MNDGEDRVSDSYVEKVRNVPLLHEQGDGVKSYAGILFEAVATERDITLIDEPEAFLHPPQMRKLGETLAEEVQGQLIVSTHSSDIMRGFLSGSRGAIRIMRMQRNGDVNEVTEASVNTIKVLWEQPDLRYSNALDGIFHEQTIICEDDSDCRLYNSLADHMQKSQGEPWLDTAYVPAGGKHGIHRIAIVLRAIGVKVAAVYDIDFLSDKILVKEAVTAFGGDWDFVEPLWSKVDAAVRNGLKPLSVEEMKTEIVGLIEESSHEHLPRGDIIDTMKQGKAWSKLKKYGVRGVPNGQAQTDYNALDTALRSFGIFVVPVGEAENFCPQIGLHGPKFVTKLLRDMSLDDEALMDLRTFTAAIHNA